MKPVEIEFLMKNDTKTGFAEILASSATTDQKLSMTQAVIARLREELGRLQTQMQSNPTIDNSANIAQIEQFITVLEGLEMQIKETGATATSVAGKVQATPITPTDIPKAQRSFNGLNMSIQQIAREMPSLAMGPQMFFMAISNNLPVFIDSITLARLEYEALTKAGQKAVPVWKQILKSIMSWQTAITVGIMLLVMYGDEIAEWVGSLFKGEEQLSATERAQRGLSAAIKESGYGIGDEIVLLRRLSDEWLSLGDNLDAKKKFIKDNQSAFEDLGVAISDVNDAENLLLVNTPDFIEALRLRAEAAAANKLAAEKYEEALVAERQQKEDEAALETTPQYVSQDKVVISGTGSQGYGYKGKQLINDEYTALEESIEASKSAAAAAREEAEAYYDTSTALEVRAAALMKGAGIKETTDNDDPVDDAEREADRRLRAQQQLDNEMIALTRQNQQEQIDLMSEGTNKKLEQIRHDYEVRADEIARQEAAFRDMNEAAGNGSDLTADQQAQIAEAERLNAERRKQAIGEVYRAEFEEMQTALKEYGSYYQQKLAIASEYQDKINRAASEVERQHLERQRDSSLAHIEAQELKANIDWATIFGEFGGMFHELIAPALKDAQAYMQTDEFKNADHDSQQALIEAVRQMQAGSGEGWADRVSFKRLGEEIAQYQRALSDLRNAQTDYAGLYDTLKEAQNRYVVAQQSGTETEQESARLALEAAQRNVLTAETNIQALQDQANAAQGTVTQTANRLKTGMDQVMGGLSQIASGSISGAYNGLIQLGNGAKEIGGKLGDAFGKVSDTLEDVPIVGWIVSIIDLFKDGLSVVIEGLLDAVFDAVSGIIGDVLSGDLAVTIGESILSGVGKIFDSLTFGGFSSWIGNGESDKTLKEDVERLTASNENLKDSIDKLSEKMEEVATSEASDTYQRQKELLEEQIANTQEMMRRSGAAYDNGVFGIGGEHSSNHEINEGMSSSDWARINKVLQDNGYASRVYSAADFWNLSSEEMAKIKEEATDLYSKIEALADDGHANAAQYMDEYVEYYRQLEELQDAYYEKLTNVSFDSVKDEFRNKLLDMESDAEDFAEDFSKKMREAVVESMMSEKYDDMLRDWYVAFADAMQDGLLSDTERNVLQEMYENIYKEALSERDALTSALGIEGSSGSFSQSGKSGGFETMTQDQGTKLEGLFTAGQMHWSSIDSKMDNVTDALGESLDVLDDIKENTDSIPIILAEIRKWIRDGVKVK